MGALQPGHQPRRRMLVLAHGPTMPGESCCSIFTTTHRTHLQPDRGTRRKCKRAARTMRATYGPDAKDSRGYQRSLTGTQPR
jgi:hypothetical protein